MSAFRTTPWSLVACRFYALWRHVGEQCVGTRTATKWSRGLHEGGRPLNKRLSSTSAPVGTYLSAFPTRSSPPSKMPVKVPRNENFAKLGAGYLFPVINQKKREFLAANPDAKLISLGPSPRTP